MVEKTIAVIMTVHNRKEKTLLCLNKLYGQHMPENYNLEVWITDDGCTDGTREAVQADYPCVHVVDGDGKLYWNRGMRKAWEHAVEYKRYDFYLWLNDDTDLYEFAILELLKESEKHGEKCIIVGSCQYDDHRGVSYGGYVNGKAVMPAGDAIEVDYFNGNIVLVPDYVFQIIGNLDPYFSHGHGDSDYGIRAKRVGIKSFVVGKYLGECNRHSYLKRCWDPQVSFIERFRNLYHPTGYPPAEFFYFERKHEGFFMAVIHLFTLYARVLFPQLWCWMGKAKV